MMVEGTGAFWSGILKPDVYGVRVHLPLAVDVSLPPLDNIGFSVVCHAFAPRVSSLSQNGRYK